MLCAKNILPKPIVIMALFSFPGIFDIQKIYEMPIKFTLFSIHNDKGETSKGIWHPRYMTLSEGMFISWECKKSHSWTRNIPTDRILNHRGPCFIIMGWARAHGTKGMHHLAPDLVSCITKCFRNKRELNSSV